MATGDALVEISEANTVQVRLSDPPLNFDWLPHASFNYILLLESCRDQAGFSSHTEVARKQPPHDKTAPQMSTA